MNEGRGLKVKRDASIRPSRRLKPGHSTARAASAFSDRIFILHTPSRVGPKGTLVSRLYVPMYGKINGNGQCTMVFNNRVSTLPCTYVVDRVCTVYRVVSIAHANHACHSWLLHMACRISCHKTQSTSTTRAYKPPCTAVTNQVEGPDEPCPDLANPRKDPQREDAVPTRPSLAQAISRRVILPRTLKAGQPGRT